MKDNKLKIKILNAKPEDVRGIADVAYKTWLATYPNKKYRITAADIKYMYRNRNKKEDLSKRKEDILHPKKGVKRFVAKDGSKIVGICGIIVDKKKNQLKSIYVLPKYQGSGIGYALWKNAEKHFNKKNKTIVQLAVYNTQAMEFYKKLRFVNTAKYFLQDRFKMRNGAQMPETEMILKPKINFKKKNKTIGGLIDMKHELMKLPYAYNALEPYIDEATMTIHHDKHHQTYVDKFNAALEPYPELQKLKIEEVLKDLNKIPEAGRNAIKNHGGGVLNHNMFWTIMKKDVPITKTMSEAINTAFGGFDNFKKQFSDSAMNRFGSGWAWLVVNNGKLEIVSTANQDTPLSDGKKPILLIDVWEHSYYLKFQNRRAEYVETFFKVINWKEVEKNYKEALKK